MSTVMDRIKSSYADERIRIVIEEWGDDSGPLVAYSKLFTVQDERRIVAQTKGDADDPETWGRVVFRKLEDKHGEPIFRGGDFQQFMRAASAATVRRIGAQIYSATPSVEEAEGNSEGTPD